MVKHQSVSIQFIIILTYDVFLENGYTKEEQKND